MSDWLWILTPVALVMYFRVRPQHFADFLGWLMWLAT